jgi:hypothetical protein
MDPCFVQGCVVNTGHGICFQLKGAAMYCSINSSVQCTTVYLSLGDLFLSFTTTGPFSGQGWIVNTGHETCLPVENSNYVYLHQQLNAMQFSVSKPWCFVPFLHHHGPCSGQGWIVNTGHETCLPAEKCHYVCQHQQLNGIQFGVSKPWCFVPFLYHHGPLFRARLNCEHRPWDMSSSWK